MLIDDATLAKLEEVEKKATDGPWDYDGQHNEIITPTTDAEQYWLIVSECRSAPDQTAERDQFGHHYDANFGLIAQARNALPDLLATIRALKAALETMLAHWDKVYPDTAFIGGPQADSGTKAVVRLRKVMRAVLRGEEAPCPSE